MQERKPLDADLRQFLENEAARLAPLTPAPLTNDQRVSQIRASMVRALESRTSIAGLPNNVETRAIQLKSGLTGRLFLPPAFDSPKPLLVYVHGGGWVAGSVALFDPFCRLLSEAADVIILSVEYRLAPEHPYPAALEDTLTAVHWAAAHAAECGGDPARIALAGDSAGGNLAAVAANRLCSQTPLRGLLMLYPITDHPASGHPSYSENANGYGLDAELMHWYWQQYAPDVSAQDPNVYPLRLEHVPALPPTLVATAEYDVLRDEGIAYARKLEAAHVRVTHLHAPDMAHNFPVSPRFVGRFPQSQNTLAEIAAWLKTTLHPAW
jgi:acetyl esterase